MQPPRMLAHTTKKRSVSMGFPGPTIGSHHPGLPVTGCRLATYWSMVSAWAMRMALDLSALSSPQVVYATRNGASSRPQSSRSGSLAGTSRTAQLGLFASMSRTSEAATNSRGFTVFISAVS